jgi:hypothetical protein
MVERLGVTLRFDRAHRPSFDPEALDGERVEGRFSTGAAGVSDADESDTIRGQVTAAIALSGPFLLTH